MLIRAKLLLEWQESAEGDAVVLRRTRSAPVPDAGFRTRSATAVAWADGSSA